MRKRTRTKACEPATPAPILEVRVDQNAAPGDFLPALARLLRRLRDTRKIEADVDGSEKAKGEGEE
jgi:hypothetical protein